MLIHKYTQILLLGEMGFSGGLLEPTDVSNNGKGAKVTCSGKVSGMTVAGQLALLFMFSGVIRLLDPSFIRNRYSDNET